jgi:hypothetical protein
MIVPSDLCHMRGLECACAPGTCDQQPKAAAVPLIRPTNRDMLVVFVACIVLAVIVGGTVQALRIQEHQFQLQERV